MNELMECLLSRRSVREYDPRPVPPELVEAVLEAGINAPSAHDSRPWRFYLFDRAPDRARLLDALSARFAADLRAKGFPEEEVRARLGRSRRIFGDAPVLIVPFVSLAGRENPLAGGPEVERALAAQSVALAAGQMLLAAHGLGLGMCWFAAPLFCPGEVCAACGEDPARWAPQCLLTLGYPKPGSRPKPKPRPERDDYVLRPHAAEAGGAL